jgi:hypothetical protein
MILIDVGVFTEVDHSNYCKYSLGFHSSKQRLFTPTTVATTVNAHSSDTPQPSNKPTDEITDPLSSPEIDMSI